ncbi:MAG: hypothetical protein ABDK92_10875, partial [Atribacterota bacterium]
MKRTLGLVLLVFLCWNIGTRLSFAKILSPDEAIPLLRRMVEKMTHQNYWGVWEVVDRSPRERRFYEVLFLKGIGFGWKELGTEDLFWVKVGNYRYLFDLISGKVQSVHPFYSLPFLPFEKDDLELLLQNYLIYFQDNRLSLFSRYTGEIVRSLVLDGDGFLASHVGYVSGGKAQEEGRFVYLDFSPDYRRLARYLELMEKCSLEKASEELSVTERKKIFLPRLVPPGFQLKRTYIAKSGGKAFYHLVYSDGLQYFTISQSVDPR